ncbi:hypothetical protein V5N11_002938 [Cardamine amara subsp. amara]|uniref:CCHC-type domain-containing protein n=1 Tax=Cardamine amara subsp. amara TaxID=228776 RepID=A0ABD0ZVT5_CARAN
MDHLPSLGEAVCFVAHRDMSSEVSTNLGHGDSSAGSKLDSSVLRNPTRSEVCEHCGRSGHEKRECWQLVGFLDWWVERSERRSWWSWQGTWLLLRSWHYKKTCNL